MSKSDKNDEIKCVKPKVLRQNPAGIPPINPPPFPPTAYGLATVDTANHVLYVGGLQGFLPNGDLAPTVQERVRLAYESMYAIARFYGASPLDVLRLVLYVNPDSPIAIAQVPGTTSYDRFFAIRGIANDVQAPIYGDHPPARTLIGVTQIVLQDVFEIEGTFLIPVKQVQCVEKKKHHHKKHHHKKHHKKHGSSSTSSSSSSSSSSC